MNDKQIKLFKQLIKKINNKDELILLYYSVDYNELRKIIYEYWCLEIGTKKELKQLLSEI